MLPVCACGMCSLNGLGFTHLGNGWTHSHLSHDSQIEIRSFSPLKNPFWFLHCLLEAISFLVWHGRASMIFLVPSFLALSHLMQIPVLPHHTHQSVISQFQGKLPCSFCWVVPWGTLLKQLPLWNVNIYLHVSLFANWLFEGQRLHILFFLYSFGIAGCPAQGFMLGKCYVTVLHSEPQRLCLCWVNIVIVDLHEQRY